ncbi:MAG TPA: GLUG motif-containing protein [Candidatus Acidoferrum sp.]|nr:GLUG motif-containing protein [Candidatus Acidoferrum sp.]
MIKKKSKKILSILLAIAFLTALCPQMTMPAGAVGAEGSWPDYATWAPPLAGGTYTVTTAGELAWVAQYVNNGDGDFDGYTIKLGADIDLSAHYWAPIGGSNPFRGNFDGNGYRISGLTISGALKHAGLIGWAYYNTVEDVELDGVSIEVTYGGEYVYTGGLAGRSSGASFINCSVAGDVSLTAGNYNAYCGGLVGKQEYGGSIEGCSVSGTVTASMNMLETYCGGLAGSIMDACVSDCEVSAEVGTSADYLGGLVGALFDTTVRRSSATGSVENEYSGELSPFTGGFAGLVRNDGGGCRIEDCAAGADVIRDSSSGSVGGFAGFSTGYTLSRCEAVGDVTGGNQAGGFIGINYSNVTDSHAAGDVMSVSSNPSSYGGFIGENEAGAVTRCYAEGGIEAAPGGTSAGGFVGQASSGGAISACYASGDVSGGAYVGGFAGTAMGNVADCYSTGAVTGAHRAGGFVGNNFAHETSCYSTGAVDATGEHEPGGFVGLDRGSETNCYWLTGTAEAAVGGTEFDSTPTTAAVKSDEEMRDAGFPVTLNSGRSPAPWSFVIDGYPVLIGVGDGAGTGCAVTFADGDEPEAVYFVTELPEGSTLAQPSDPEKAGCIFLGWYDEAEGGDTWNFETDTVAEDITLYAHWEIIDFVVSGTVSSALASLSVEGLTVGLYGADAETFSGAPLYSAVTDESGDYAIPDVVGESYVAVVAADEGGVYAQSTTEPFTVADDTDADIALNIICRVSGTVTLSDGTTPAAGVALKLYIVDFSSGELELAVFSEAAADAAGAYEFTFESPESGMFFVFASPYPSGGITYGGNMAMAGIDMDSSASCEGVDIALVDLSNSWLGRAQTPDGYEPGDDEITVDTPEELAWLAQQSLLYFEDFEDCAIYLEEDLDLSGYDWWPICSVNAFAGVFFGGGHVISNLNADVFYDTEEDSIYTEGSAGLFGDIVGGAVLDLGLTDVALTIDSNFDGEDELCAGALAAYAADAYIEGCYSTGVITSSVSGSMVGGLIGQAYNSTFIECYSECDISGSFDHSAPEYEGFSGGLLGYFGCNYGSFDEYPYMVNCYATGDVTGTSNYNGGFVGCYYGEDMTIANCYATGLVTGATYNGSFAGYGQCDDYISNIHWLLRGEMPGIAQGDEDSLALNDPELGLGKSAGDMAVQTFADTLNLDEEEDDSDPWRWYADVNGGYPVLDGVGAGDMTTSTVVTIRAIAGVTPPVRGAVPVTAITLTPQYMGAVSWSPADSPFAASTVYTATITLTLAPGYTLDGVSENFFTVAGATSATNEADSGVITAVFPATGAASSHSGGGGGGGSAPPAANPNLIPVADLTDSGGRKTIAVESDIATVSVPSNMLTGIAGINGENAEIIIGEGDKSALPDDVKAAVGGRPLISLTLEIDGKQTNWSNPAAPVTVSIPYAPTAAELANPAGIVVWYIDGDGNAVCVPNGRYDPVTGTVTFETTHFSDYAVVYNEVAFTDVPASAWYAKAVAFIAAREITSGTGDGTTFSPEAKLTRGEFLVLMMRAYGIAPDEAPTDNFADAGDTYYTGYLAAAKSLGISNGVGDNLYNPVAQITRQEMFTLLYNALDVMGQLPDGESGKTMDDFTDSAQIASWAKEAMALMIETGIAGGSQGLISPTGTTSRAQMAQVLFNLLGF